MKNKRFTTTCQFTLGLMLLLPLVLAADTQTRFVGTATTTVLSSGKDWSSPTNVTADDATYSRLSAKVKNGGHSYYLDATMSENVFTIPTDATINGITVNIVFFINDGA